MRINTTAHGLLLASVLTAAALNGGCGDDDDAGTTGTTGTTGTVEMPTIPAECMSDADTGTATFTLTHLGVAEQDGFDFDGINNAAAPAGMGVTVPGCGETDLPAGRDNALANIAAGINAIVSLDTSLQNTLVHTAGDGGTTGSLTATIALSKLAASGAANDPSLCATLTLTTSGAASSGTTTYAARGAMVNNTVFLAFDATPVFDIELPLPSGSCNDMMCQPAVLRIPMRGARARLSLNSAHTTMLAGSVLGGFVFFGDMGAGYTAEQNTTGFGASLLSFATMSNSTPAVATMARAAIQASLDLHMQPDNTLAPCTGANTSSTDANTLSAAISIDSVAP